jgi:hypothetical protein
LDGSDQTSTTVFVTKTIDAAESLTQFKKGYEKGATDQFQEDRPNIVSQKELNDRLNQAYLNGFNDCVAQK